MSELVLRPSHLQGADVPSLKGRRAVWWDCWIVLGIVGVADDNQPSSIRFGHERLFAKVQ